LPAAAAGAYSPILPVGLGDNANPVQVNLSYNGTVLTAKFTDTVALTTFTTNYTVNIPSIIGANDAYIGFTGADGGVASTMVISNFTMGASAVALKAVKLGSTLQISWPAAAAGCLQSASALGSPTVWSDVTETQRVVGAEVQVNITPLPNSKFYRLIQFP